MAGIRRILGLFIVFSMLVATGVGEAAELKYRVRKRLCSDVFCPLENELMAFLYPAFIDATGQLAGDEVISNAVEINGYDGFARVWVDGDSSARVRVNGGSWQTIADARAGSQVELKLVASTIPGYTVGATAHVGTKSASWHVTTAGGTAVTFSAPFAEKTGQDTGVNVLSNEVEVTYSGDALTATVSGGQDACIIVNWVGGCYASQQVSSGDTLQLRVKTPATPGTREMSRLTVGASYADWYVKTAGEAAVDYSGSFTNLSGQLENDRVTSNAITVIGGFEGAVSATVSGDGNPEVSVNGGAWATTASVVRNDSVRLRMTTAGTQNTGSTARLTAGGVETAWLVETGSPTVSFSGDFTDLSDQDKNIQIDTGADLTVTGISGTLLASASGEGNPEISTDGGLTWGATANVGDGATIRLRMTTASTDGTMRTARISIGSSFRDWAVTTGGTASAVLPSPGVVINEINTSKNAGTSGPATVRAFATVGGGWDGGILAPNGKIYCIPYTAGRILEIDPVAGTTTTFGSASTSIAYFGGVLGPDGHIYMAPYAAGNVLDLDPDTKTISTFGSYGSGRFLGAVLSANGKMNIFPAYFGPTSLLKIDLDTKTMTSTVVGAGLHGGVLAPNGKIYSVPYYGGSGQIMVYDPATDTAKHIGPKITTTTWAWGGMAIAPNGKLYGFPAQEGRVIEIDPATDDISFIPLPAGAAGGYYSNGALAPDGKLYAAPRWSAPGILVVDPEARTASILDIPAGIPQQGWLGTVLAPNGKLYAIPLETNVILEIDPHANRMWAGGIEQSAYFNKQ